MFFFVKDRYASGDMKGIKLGDNARLLSKEWAALSPSDRKVGRPSIFVGHMILMFPDLRKPSRCRQTTIHPRIQDSIPS
jgi:hypothetical protein